MLGIGLGAFVDGMTAGVGIGRGLRNDRRMEEEDTRRRTREDAIESRNQQRFDREQSEWERSDRNRSALEGIDEQARTEFDSRVEAGEAQPDQYEAFWEQYALPKRRNELLRQGNVEGAVRLQEWGESADAKRGGRLFGSALRKAQTGDHEGALEDAIEIGKLKGYIEGGYEIADSKPIKSADGTIVGYRLKIREGDGEIVEQDVAIDDIPGLLATFASPDVAWQSQQAARAEKKKQDDEIATHRRKKEVDREMSADPRKLYDDARKALEESDYDWGTRTPEEQDRLIRERIETADRFATERGAAAPGQVAAPGAAPEAAGARAPKIVVDRQSGKPVNPASLPGIGRQDEAPPAGVRRPEPALQAAPSARQAQEQSIGAHRRLAGPVENADPARSGPDAAREQMLDEAAGLILQGASPQDVARRLYDGGVGKNEIGPAVDAAVRRAEEMRPAR